MEKIAQITGTLCIAVFSMGLLYQFGGFAKTAKIVRFIIALCIVSTVFSDTGYISFTPFLREINNNEIQYNFKESFYRDVLYETNIQIENTIKNRLREKNISYNYVGVHILEQNGNLTADEIIIICDESYADAAYSCIEDIISENTTVSIGE